MNQYLKQWPELCQQVLELPADLAFFLVFPFPYFELSLKNGHKEPYLLTYRSDKITFKDLILQYRNQRSMKQNIYFNLQKGYRPDNDLKVRDLKNLLRNRHINGTHLYVTIEKKQCEFEQFEDESTMGNFINQQLSLGKEMIKIKTAINSNQHITLFFSQTPNVNDLIVSLLKEISKQCGINLKKEDISEILDYNNQTISNYERCLYMPSKDSKQDFLRVKFRKQQNLKKIINQNRTLTIQGKQLKQPVVLCFDEIANMDLIDVFDEYFSFKNTSICDEYCLQIHDLLIKPREKMNKISSVFFNSDIDKPIKLVGDLIPEKIVFYKFLTELTDSEKGKSFDSTEIPLPENQLSLRKQFDQQIQQASERLSSDSHFKDKKNIEPIFIYTSQLKCKVSQDKEQAIYKVVNLFLANQNFCVKQLQEIQSSWMYRYTSHLLRSLSKLKDVQATVYRGTSKDFIKSQVGDIVTFKQFTSTSRQISVAKGFTKIKGKVSDTATLAKINVKTGKSIKQLSYFGQLQSEILLPPYTKLQVTKVTLKYQGLFTLYQLKEVESSTQMPTSKVNFILWIDDKPLEGSSIYNQINFDFETTILITLLTTQELDKWLTNHSSTLADPMAKVIAITNMTRKQQDQIVDQQAGVKVAKLLQKHPKIPLFFYIGKIPKCRQKLAKNKIDCQKFIISDKKQDVIAFIKQKCGLKKQKTSKMNPETKEEQNIKKSICSIQ